MPRCTQTLLSIRPSPAIHTPSIPGHADICIFNCDDLTIFQLVKKYGNVMSMQLGDLPLVLITGLPLIKEVLVDQNQIFVNRPITPIRERIFKNNGKFLNQYKMAMFDILWSVKGASVTIILQHSQGTGPL